MIRKYTVTHSKDIEGYKSNIIPFHKLFSYSGRCDILLVTIGIVSSVGMGLIWPAVILIFGSVTDTLAEFQNDMTNLIRRLVMMYNETIPSNPSMDYIIGRLKHHDPSFKMEDKYDIMGIMQPLCQYYAAIALAMFVLSYISVSCLLISAQNQVTAIRKAFFRSVLRQDISWFDKQSSGMLNNNLVDDINIIHDGIGQKIGQMILWLSCGLGSIALAFYKSWKLSLVSLAISPVLGITMFILTVIMTSLNKSESLAYGKAGSIAEEVLGSIRTVVSFGGEKFEAERYTANLEFACRAGKKKGLLTGIVVGLLSGLIFVSFSVGFWYGAKMVRENEILVGTALIIFFSCMLASIGFGQAFPHFSALNRARTAATKIFEINKRIPEIDKNSECGIKLPNLVGDIRFNGVRFHYPSRPECEVLRGLSLSVKSGQTIALVGASGCGKSSVIQLIQRFYEVTNGKILIDNRPVRDFNVMWLREQIGVVSQEPILFACSIKENIQYGRVDVTDEEIWASLIKANADGFVEKLPHGLDTIIGDRGAQLSGGQKQRIAIARALVRNPKILLLDEATSALDSRSESIVQKALDNARVGRTTVVVAHRLSTIKNADVIICIKNGQVVESGNHETLIAQKGIYKDLVDRQKAAKYETEIQNKIEEFFNFKKESIEDGDISLEDNLHSNVVAKVAKKGNKKYFRRVMNLNLPEKWFICLGCLGSLLNGATQPAFSVLFGYIIPAMADQDKAKQERLIERYVIIMTCMAVVAFVANVIQNYGFAESGERLTKKCRSLTFKAMLRQEMGWFDMPNNNVGVLTTRLSEEASAIRGLSGESFGFFCQAISSIGVAFVISLAYAWQIALVSLAFMPFILVGGYLQMKLMKGPTSSDMKALEESGKVAAESIENIRTVSNLTVESTFIAVYEKKIMQMMQGLAKKSQIQAFLFGLTNATVLCAYSACFIMAGYLLKQGTSKMENVYIAFGAMIFGAIFLGGSLAMGPKFGKGIIAAKNMFELIDRKPSIDSYSEEGVDPNSLTSLGTVQLEKVHFKYPLRPEIEILRNIVMDITPGTTVALVGHSGCGKSTVIQLLQRLYDVNLGRLAISNQNIKGLKIRPLREVFGLVSQEPVLFSYSIKENIAYADSSNRFNSTQIEDAAKTANIHNFIMDLPDKYETVVGERGCNLSGGQKQRIAIARAVLRNPKILLLDEATSALDSENEKIVQEALDRIQEDRTCIVIAHRLSTIQHVDKILVFDEGEIVEAGTHGDLMQKKGLYFQMFNITQ